MAAERKRLLGKLIYKPATIHRRIQRRMGLNQINNVADYYRLLSQQPDELVW